MLRIGHFIGYMVGLCRRKGGRSRRKDSICSQLYIRLSGIFGCFYGGAKRKGMLIDGLLQKERRKKLREGLDMLFIGYSVYQVYTCMVIHMA